MTQAVEAVEQQGLAAVFGQFSQRLLQQLQLLAHFHQCGGARAWVEELVLHIFQRIHRPTSRAATAQVDDQVAHDANEEKSRIGDGMGALLPVETDVAYERVLHEVGRHFPVTEAPVGNLLQFAMVEAKQPIQMIQMHTP